MSLIVRSVALTVAALSLSIAGAALAAPTTTPVNANTNAPASGPTSTVAVDVELADAAASTAGASTSTMRVTLTLAGDHGCGSASTQRGPLRWDVGVCRDGGTAEAPVLVFNIERTDGAPPATRVQKVRVASRLATGRRATVGRIAQPDGATEITATAHEP